jgi:hypothetical protein
MAPSIPSTSVNDGARTEQRRDVTAALRWRQRRPSSPLDQSPQLHPRAWKAPLIAAHTEPVRSFCSGGSHQRFRRPYPATPDARPSKSVGLTLPSTSLPDYSHRGRSTGPHGEISVCSALFRARLRLSLHNCTSPRTAHPRALQSHRAPMPTNGPTSSRAHSSTSPSMAGIVAV